MYMRWWVLFQNGPNFNPFVSTKHFYNKSGPGVNGGAEAIWVTLPGTHTMGVALDHPTAVQCNNPLNGNVTSSECLYSANMAQPAIDDGAWHCIETHAKIEPVVGVATGVLEIWVDTSLILQYLNLNVSTTGFDSFWETETHFAQHGGGDRYVDDFVEGDARIGCGTATAPVPPGTPANLTVTWHRRLFRWLAWFTGQPLPLIA
jgi:hypothetical protein